MTFDLWMFLVPGGILALLVGVALFIPKKIRRIGLVIMSVAKAHQQVQIGMSKAEVKDLLGLPDSVASAEPTGKLQAGVCRRDFVSLSAPTDIYPINHKSCGVV